ncbi:hypothetical protein IH970_01190 [candidate division KSB1 bacterium]|nr:hypothetical protein [candidate division KSB1 bacterium]
MADKKIAPRRLRNQGAIKKELLQRKPAAYFEENDICCIFLKQIIKIVAERKIAVLYKASALLGPDEKDGGSGIVLPAYDQIRAELAEIKVGIA